VERVDAERVFSLVAEINGDLRGRIVSERWWLVWIVLGLEMLATCAATQALLWRGEGRLPAFAALWGAHLLLIPIIIAALHRRSGGQRTATERYIWWIWATFILCSIGVALFNALAGLPLFFTLPVLALLAAFAFSMMAMVTHARFLLCAGYFLLTMPAMSGWPQHQFLIFGAAWCVLLIALGVTFRAQLRPVRAVRL
jgi:hypothetical protein